MHYIQSLAPTIIDAVTAVEHGCRKVQDDAQFEPRMWAWLAIGRNMCYGCLATSTLMQLTNQTGKDIIDKVTEGKAIEEGPFDQSRAFVFGIVEQPSGDNITFNRFEVAIDSLRHGDIWPLLKFYQLENHPNAGEAVKYLYQYQPLFLNDDTIKTCLKVYADFLRDYYIPQLVQWFPVTE